MEGTFKAIVNGREFEVSKFEVVSKEDGIVILPLFDSLNGGVNIDGLEGHLTGFFYGGDYVARVTGCYEGEGEEEIEIPYEENEPFEAILLAMPE